MFRALRRQATRPGVLAVRTRGGTTVVHDLAVVRARIRSVVNGQAQQARYSDMAMPSQAMASYQHMSGATAGAAEQSVEKPKSWMPELVQGPWHVLTPAGLAVVNTCGNLCGLGAAASHDHVTMRTFAVCSSTAVAAFNFLMPKPLKAHQWTAGSWGSVFAVLHLANLCYLVNENSHSTFTPEEEEVYENGFQRFGVSPHQFKNLIQAGGTYQDFAPGEVIAEAGKPVDKVFYVVKGTCEARQPESKALRIEYHDDVFVGCLEPKAWQAECQHKPMPVDEESAQQADHEPHRHESHNNMRGMLVHGLEERAGPRTKLLAGTSWQDNNTAGPDGCRALSWPLAEFAASVGKDDKLVTAMERLDEMGLACKICWGASHMAFEGYKELLDAVSSEGWVKPEDKRALARYRARFGVPEAEHLRMLKELKWTQQEFEDGYKKQV